MQNTKPKPSIKLNYNIKQTRPFFNDSKCSSITM